jgi:hypothetical protein
VLEEKRNILGPLAQAGHQNLKCTESVEKIFAKSSGKNLSPQITVRGRDDSDVNFLYTGRANPLYFSVLNHPQQLCLQRESCLADFVKKYRTSIRVLKQAGRVSVAPVKEPRI